MSDFVELTPAVLQDCPLPSLGGDSDKDQRGCVLSIAGSGRVPGAAVLCATAALRVGAGKLQMAAPSLFSQALAFAVPEAMVIGMGDPDAEELAGPDAQMLAPLLGSVDAVIIGPGMLERGGAGALAAELLRSAPDAAFLIDAAAMTGLKDQSGISPLCRGRAVLTPHMGEMAKLMDASIEAVRAEPLAIARTAAAQFNAVVVLKSQQSHIVTPDGQAWRNSGGAVGLGTCGSGDVLAGCIGGLLARGASPAVAAIWGVYLHAQAGRRLTSRIGALGFLAREIVGELPHVMAECV